MQLFGVVEKEGRSCAAKPIYDVRKTSCEWHPNFVKDLLVYLFLHREEGIGVTGENDGLGTAEGKSSIANLGEE